MLDPNDSPPSWWYDPPESAHVRGCPSFLDGDCGVCICELMGEVE